MSKIDHPNVVQFYEYYEDKKKLYIVSELCEGGELFDKITERTRFTESEARKLMMQLLGAIKFCHKHGIVHRDIKPENIVYSSRVTDEIKVIDFGASTEYSQGIKLKERIGTPYYIAPEVIKNDYGKECDIWSCGVLLYILLSGYPPFNGRNNNQIINAVKSGKFDLKRKSFERVSNKAKDLIKKLLTYDPA